MDSETPVVPGYKILSPLGVGGMASVYLAMQESLDREVALKIMAPALAVNKEFTERFLKEGRITARLSHPNLVTVHDIGQCGSIYYLAAEFIPGGTLREKLDAGLTTADALHATCDVAMGLHYAHEKGFVHRDVKPGNVLFRNNGSAVLADFGIAKAVDSSTMATQAGSSIGTPHYMSPEQARAEKVDGRSDLYSMGAMLFELLTGRLPYDASDPFTIALMHVTHPLPRLPEELSWLQPLIDGLMDKDPNKRFPTGEAFVEACEKLLASAPQGQAIRSGTDTRRRLAVRLTSTQPQVALAADVAAAAAPAASPQAASAAAGPQATSRPLPKPLLAGVAAALLLAIVGGIWIARPKPALPPPTDLKPPVSTVIQPNGNLDPTLPAGDNSASSGDVIGQSFDNNNPAQLIARANAFVKMGFAENGRRLTSPDGDCAVDLYKRALELRPGDAQAQAGLSQIAAFFESKARATFDRGLMQGSLVLAEEGLKAQPDHPGLKKIADDARKASGQ